MLKRVFLILFVCFLTAINVFSQINSYSFFIAGHVSGNPGVQNVGFHPPFKAKFDYIKAREEIEFGVLLGDCVKFPTTENWENVVADISDLGLPVYIAVGNHDMYDPQPYYDQFGDSTYYSFSHKNDLFIILDPNIDEWNISGDQLVFLQNTLEQEAELHDNIFVMMHQLLWWASDNDYADVHVNSTEGRADEINFWTEIEPLFNELENKVVMCAGDIGAASYSSDFMYDHYDNITYIATGMGKGDSDNFVIINVDESKNLDYELICLNNEELYCFGDLTDYQISNSEHITTNQSINLYPNPVSDVLNIDGNNISKIELLNTYGAKVYGINNIRDFQIKINMSNFESGIYILRVQTDIGFSYFKISKI